MRFKAACVQMNASEDPAANIAAVSALIRAARADGADFIATPENTGIMAARREASLAAAAPESDHPALLAYRALAAETGAWLLIGSLGVKIEGETRIANRSFLLDPKGGIAATYDKIHMFDVTLDGGESYQESRAFRPGAAARLSALPWGLLGMSVCYDLRFPHLYRLLAKAGASFLSIPSAFTEKTGKAHWHVLLRARAIETGCYVFAPAQTGEHAGGRRTFGHSLIIDPWGEILADGGTETGFVLAEIDPERVARVRSAVPSLSHDRVILPPEVPTAQRPAAE